MKKRYSTIMAEDAPFNSSMAYLERLERRWEDADDSKIGGSIVQYFRVLNTIFMNSHPFFNIEEQKECEDLIEVCDKEIKNLGANNDPRAVELMVTDAEKILDKLRKELIKLLFKYKITYYQKDRQSWDEELEDDFK